MAKVGRKRGHKHTEETKRKISESRRRAWETQSRVKTEETRQKLRMARLGKKNINGHMQFPDEQEMILSILRGEYYDNLPRQIQSTETQSDSR